MEIKLENVGYIYNDKTPLKKVALKDIDIEIKEGMINGIVGPSGSGKTTIAEIMNALILPTSGKAKVGEFLLERKVKIKNINDLRFNVGLVFQFPEEQFFNTSVRKELSFALKRFKYKTNNIEKHISDALKMVGLDDSYLDRDPFLLSNGEKRKIAIASILSFNPNVLILDEPTIGLDNKSKQDLIRLFKLLKKRYNKTIIVISHDVEFLHLMVDYVFVINDGKVVLEGNKYEVFTNPNLASYKVKPPKIIEFSMKVLEKKNIRMGYRDDINDLMKDVYRNVK